MSTNLENKLNAILNEKKEKILPQNIKKGVTVFDITGELEGLDTSDATALEKDIVKGKTAYVKGQKITGNVEEVLSNLISKVYNTTIYVGNNQVTFTSGSMNSDFLLRNGATVQIPANNTNVASAIGLTAEKIAKGNNILGIEGTHEGGGDITETEDYQSCLELSELILTENDYLPVKEGLILDLEAEQENIDTSSGVTWKDPTNLKDISVSNAAVDTDNSIIFNGTNTEFDTGITQESLLTGYTILLRIKPNKWGNHRGVCGIHIETTDGLSGIAGLQYVNGVIGFAHAGSGGVKVSLTENDLPVNEWSTIIITSDGNNNCYAYINGELVGTSNNHGILKPYGNLIIGKGHNNADRFFKGNISHCMIYSRPLEEQEVVDINNYIEERTQ